MEDIYEIIHILTYRLNDMRNQLNIAVKTGNLFVKDLMDVTNGNIIFYKPVNIWATEDVVSNGIYDANLGALIISGGASIWKNLYVNENIKCDGSLLLTDGNVLVEGNMNVTGTANITGNIIFNGDMFFNGISNINSITGNVININFQNIYSNLIYANKFIDVNAEDRLNGNLVVANIINTLILNAGNINVQQGYFDYIQANQVLVKGDLNIDQNLRVYGGANLFGNIIVNDLKVLGNLEVLQQIISNGDINMTGSLNINSGTLNVEGNINSNNDLVINGNLNCIGNIFANGIITSNLFFNQIINVPFYGNDNIIICNSNLQFMRDNRTCSIKMLNNFSNIINSSLSDIYVNVGNVLGSNYKYFIPNIINNVSSSSISDLSGYELYIKGNVNGNGIPLTVSYPDYYFSGNVIYPQIRIRPYDDSLIKSNLSFSRFNIMFFSDSRY